ncbi:hypothetical protein KAZ92_00415 [Candidatus Gracilibacteria bacterium]|nr:hypothetical protein [Candidatus Gracilibacteria bacterium]
MGTYSALEAFFQDEAPLDEAKTAELRDAILKGLNAALYGDPAIAGLARDVRTCVAEAGKFCPESLEGNTVAKGALVRIMNERGVRPILDIVWDKRRQGRIAA